MEPAVNVTLSDGTIASIPDGLDADAIKNNVQRLEVANKSSKQSQGAPGTIDFNAPVQTTNPLDAAIKYVSDRTPSVSAPSFQSADTATGGALSTAANTASAADTYLNNWPSTTGKMAAHVGSDLALGVPSVLAGGANVLSHLATKYGGAAPSPDLPIPSQSVPAAAGITPETTTAGKVTEAILTLASANKLAGAGTIWSLAKAPVQAGLQWAGSKIGEAVGGEAGGFVGGLIPGSIPLETVASKGIDLLPQGVRDTIRNPNASDIWAAVKRLGAQTGNPDLTPTAGMVGGPVVKGLEKTAQSFPGVNIPVLNARGKVGAGLKAGVDTAASQLSDGTPINTSPGGAGAEWRGAAQDQLTQAWQTAQNNTRQVENDASSRNLTDANGNPQLVTGPVLDALRTKLNGIMGFNNQGRTISTLSGAGDATVNGVLNDIASKLQDQDPILGLNLRQNQGQIQNQLNDPNTPAAAKPALQQQLDQVNQDIADNKGVSFDTLRQHKSNMGNLAQQGDWVAGEVTDALRDALGAHLNAVDPNGLGQRYANAVQGYNDAMNLKRSFTTARTNAVGTTNSPGEYTNTPGDTQLANAADNLLRNPQNAEPYLNTPGFRNVLAAVVQGLGQKNNRFDPTEAAKEIGGITDKGKSLLTQQSAGPAGPSSTVPLLNDVRTAGDAYDLKPGPAGLSGALATTALAEGAAERGGFWKTLAGGGAAALGMERPGAVRAIAGVPQAWRQNINLPALIQLANIQAQRQAQNQGQ
jgi:hypothetical protein